MHANGRIDWGQWGARDWSPYNACLRPGSGHGPHKPLIETNNALGKRTSRTAVLQVFWRAMPAAAIDKNLYETYLGEYDVSHY